MKGLLQSMSRVEDIKCPICGGAEWKPVIKAVEYSILCCQNGCIARTYPPPEQQNEPVPEGGFDITEAQARASAEFHSAERLLSRIMKIKKQGRLLDIGSGGGHLVRAALDRGFDAVGLEMSELGIRYARDVFGLDSIRGTFPEHPFEAESFDIVILKHTLEHMPEPLSVLRAVEEILCPGGLAAVEFPNFNSLMRRIKGREWRGLQPSQHIWQLSESSVKSMLKSAGLIPILTARDSIDYGRGSGSLSAWLALRSVLWAAHLMRMDDNVMVIAGKL